MTEQLVPIGRFAAATRLSVKALRHYDEIGLLTPAVVDRSSGYRYYRLGQANQAEAIRVLRGVDMPLDEIAEVLRAVDGAPDVVRKVLDDHRGRLADELARHERMLAFLERLLTEEEHLMPYRITLETMPARPIASVRVHTDMDRIQADLERGFGRVFGTMGAQGHPPAGAPLVIYHELAVDEPGEIEIAVPCPPEVEEADGVGRHDLPAGDVAATVHTGPYDQIAPAYHAIQSWIAEHGHEVAGPPREIYLSDPGDTPEDQLQTRVEWPIA